MDQEARRVPKGTDLNVLRRDGETTYNFEMGGQEQRRFHKGELPIAPSSTGGQISRTGRDDPRICFVLINASIRSFEADVFIASHIACFTWWRQADTQAYRHQPGPFLWDSHPKNLCQFTRG